MNLEFIANYLASKQPTLVKGTNLFDGGMPATCTQGVLLMPPYHGAAIDHELPGYSTTVFHVTVRSTDYNAGYALARTVSKELTVQQEQNMSGVWVKLLLPLNLPRPYRRSAGAYYEFEVEVQISFIESD